MRPLADGRLDHVDNVAEAGEPISKRNKTGRPRSHGERWGPDASTPTAATVSLSEATLASSLGCQSSVAPVTVRRLGDASGVVGPLDGATVTASTDVERVQHTCELDAALAGFAACHADTTAWGAAAVHRLAVTLSTPKPANRGWQGNLGRARARASNAVLRWRLAKAASKRRRRAGGCKFKPDRNLLKEMACAVLSLSLAQGPLWGTGKCDVEHALAAWHLQTQGGAAKPALCAFPLERQWPSLGRLPRGERDGCVARMASTKMARRGLSLNPGPTD